MSGGLYLYRATAECSACGKVVDVGPFDNVASAAWVHLPGWLLPASPSPGLSWQIRTGFGALVTLCDECMGKPLRDVIEAVRERERVRT